jgi:hypothetical protein
LLFVNLKNAYLLCSKQAEHAIRAESNLRENSVETKTLKNSEMLPEGQIASK